MAEDNVGNEGTNIPQPEIASAAPPIVGGALPSSDAAPIALTIPPAPTQAPVLPPPVAPQVSASARQPGTDLQGDMDRILHGIKLPERRGAADSNAGAQSPAKQFDTTLGAIVDHETRTPPASAPVQKDPGALSAVHTLKNDMQEVVQDNKISVVRAAALEQQKKRPEPIDMEIQTRKRFPFGTIILSFIALCVIGGAAIFGVYYVLNSRTTAAPATALQSIVFAEAERSIPLDGQSSIELKQQFAQVRTSIGGTLGSITRITPTVTQPATPTTAASVRPATFGEFMHAIGAQPSDALLRALSDQFFLGIHTTDKSAPVIVVPVTSYDYAFQGMLDWEKTINADFSPFFTLVPPFTTDAQGVVQSRAFTDDVMRNYDVRELKDDNGTVELYYSFPTRNILIIAESPYSFPEILSRLQAQREL